MGLLAKLFGTSSAKELKRIEPIVQKIEALEEEYKNLTDAQLQAKTPELKGRLANGETLDILKQISQNIAVAKIVDFCRNGIADFRNSFPRPFPCRKFICSL